MKQFVLFLFAALLSTNIFGQNQHNAKVDSMESMLGKVKADSTKVKLLLNISNDIFCSDTTRSSGYLNEALFLSEKIKWRKGEMLAYQSLGYINFWCKHNNSAALRCFYASAGIGKTIKDSINQVEAYNSIARIHAKENKQDSALEYYGKCIHFNKNPRNQITYLGNSGGIYQNIGDYLNALVCYDKALKITDDILKSPDKTKLDSLAWLGLLLTVGDVYVAMPQLDKALDNYSTTLKIAESQHLLEHQIWALNNIGKVYRIKKDYAKAIQYYEKSLEASNSLNGNDYKPTILNEISKLYIETGDLTSALKYAEQALVITKKRNDKQALARSYTTIGIIKTKTKDYNKAVNYLLNALTACKNTGLVNEEKDAWEALSNAYKYMGQTGKAFDAYREFISLRDSIYSVDKAKEMVRIDLQSGFNKIQLADSLKQDETKKVFGLQLQRQRAYTYGGFAGFLLVLSLSFFIYRNYSLQKKANAMISSANETIKKEKQVSENLLLNILPEEVAQELKTNGKVHAQLYQQVTVLFTDFVNFTNAGERFTPQELVAELDACFQVFDEIIGKYDIEKIKTVGDAYLAVSGLPNANPNHANDIVKAAIEIRDFMVKRKHELGELTFGIRIGVNSGSVVAGIVGIKKFAYDIWGDTVNIAARMEQSSEVGKVNISEATYSLLTDKFNCTHRGKINAKNKGVIDMYFVD